MDSFAALIQVRILLLVLFLPVGLFADTKTISLNIQGRIVGDVPEIKDGDNIRFCIDNGGAANLRIRYVLRSVISDPAPPQHEKEIFDQQGDVDYCDPHGSGNPSGKLISVDQYRLLLYTVYGPPPLQATQQEKDARKQSLVDNKKNLAAAKDALEAAQATISSLSDEIKQFAGISGPDVLKAIETRQQQIAKQRDIVKQATPAVARLTPIVSDLEKLVALDDVNVTESVYRMGGIILGSNRKVVYYHLARGGPAQLPLHLEQIGNFPTLRRDNELYAIITDVSPLQKPDYFALTYTSEIGKPPDSAPLRPSIDQTKAGAGPAELQRELRLKNATKDFMLAFPRKLKANEVIKITVSTYYPYVSSDKTTVTAGDTTTTKHEVVTEEGNLKVLDAAEYPQVHDLYHYNLATGVVASSLHDPTFTKVKTQAGTTPTYAVIQDNGNKRIFPVLLFSFYYSPKDIVQKWSAKDMIPIPTIGFALSAPADNFFAGGSSEIRRNVQVVYGLHYGKVTKRGPIPVDETTSATAPNTRKQFEPGWFLGLSFNINFIKDLFSGK